MTRLGSYFIDKKKIGLNLTRPGLIFYWTDRDSNLNITHLKLG